MAVVNSTPVPGRARRLCFLVLRFVVCLFALGLIATDVAAGQPSLVSAVAIVLCLEHRGVATYILAQCDALVHFLRNDNEAA